MPLRDQLTFVGLVLGLASCGGAAAPPAAPPPSPPPQAPAAAAAGAPPGPPAPHAEAEHIVAPHVERPTFTVHVADVGTGLAVFVDAPDFALVYDAGSNDDLAIGADNRFVAYLKTVKPDLRKIDHVILSHPHRDHVELLADVLATYDVAQVWDSGAVNSICGYRRFVQAVADEPNVVYHTGIAGPGTHTIDFGKEVCPHKLPATVEVPHGPQIVEGVATRLGQSASMTILHV